MPIEKSDKNKKSLLQKIFGLYKLDYYKGTDSYFEPYGGLYSDRARELVSNKAQNFTSFDGDRFFWNKEKSKQYFYYFSEYIHCINKYGLENGVCVNKWNRLQNTIPTTIVLN
ncbi:hypothetical protein MHBO_000397 [Bonamia ostreae]|uniref:Uncharacterized protein n=1 Tax=Bonamia ostreae TaxID=126728 RepID=A0ABV2AG45_9EUKA